MIDQVIQELHALKKNATPSEIALLDIKTFKAYTKNQCIYGQMTGSCDSARAKELTPKTTNLYNHDRAVFTPLEVYLLRLPREAKKSTHKRIINFLKGGQKTITLR